jgi:hypothetical protein
VTDLDYCDQCGYFTRPGAKCACSLTTRIDSLEDEAAFAVSKGQDAMLRLDQAERVLRLCAGYLADENAGRVGKFNATARALEDYFGEPSLRSIADTSSEVRDAKD